MRSILVLFFSAHDTHTQKTEHLKIESRQSETVYTVFFRCVHGLRWFHSRLLSFSSCCCYCCLPFIRRNDTGRLNIMRGNVIHTNIAQYTHARAQSVKFCLCSSAIPRTMTFSVNKDSYAFLRTVLHFNIPMIITTTTTKTVFYELKKKD